MSAYTFKGMAIPGHMMTVLEDYVEKGRLPGHFLTAVLKNDLLNACGHADSTNIQILPAYVGWLYNEAPGSCWGSPENVEAYVARFKVES